MMRKSLRRFSLAALVLATVIVAVAGSLLISDRAAIVITHGASMNPVYYQDDLVVVARASAYEVGQIVAYRTPQDDAVVLHRIIGGDAAGFVLQGDNNESVDVSTPSTAQVMGEAVLHIPQGGLWFRRSTSPPVLSLIAFALMASGGAITLNRRRHKRRKTTMSRHITVAGPMSALANLPLPLKIAAAIAAVIGMTGVAVGAMAWTGPLEEPQTVHPTVPSRMEFSYTAAVESGPAYDGTTVRSPEPIFRKVVDVVDVQYSYFGDPGTLTLTAELSTQSGWHSTVPLGSSVRIAGNSYNGQVQLDLTELNSRADAGAAATGIPAGPVSVTLTPSVKDAAGIEFQPALDLTLTPLQLVLAGTADDLVVMGTTTDQDSVLVPRTIGFGGFGMTVADARIAAVAAVAMAAGTATFVFAVARRRIPAHEGQAIRAKYAPLLVRVQAMPAAAGSQVIDVSTFATLAKLAERYGLLVLHWGRDPETFIVKDESFTYRYRTNSAVACAQTPAELGTLGS